MVQWWNNILVKHIVKVRVQKSRSFNKDQTEHLKTPGISGSITVILAFLFIGYCLSVAWNIMENFVHVSWKASVSYLVIEKVHVHKVCNLSEIVRNFIDCSTGCVFYAKTVNIQCIKSFLTFLKISA